MQLQWLRPLPTCNIASNKFSTYENLFRRNFFPLLPFGFPPRVVLTTLPTFLVIIQSFLVITMHQEVWYGRYVIVNFQSLFSWNKPRKAIVAIIIQKSFKVKHSTPTLSKRPFDSLFEGKNPVDILSHIPGVFVFPSVAGFVFKLRFYLTVHSSQSQSCV